MNYVLKSKDIIERSRDLSRTNLLFIFGIIKAASIGTAVTVFLQIFIDLGPIWSWNSIWLHLPYFFQWGVSYLCLLVTFDAAMFASIFLIHIPKKSESFFTFLLVGTEALQFAILSPNLKVASQSIMSVNIEDWWYAIFCFYNIFMFFIVFFGKIQIAASKATIEKEIVEIVDHYLKSFKMAKVTISICFSFSLIIFCCLLHFDNAVYHYIIRIISSIIFLAIAFKIFFMQHKKRAEIENQFIKIIKLRNHPLKGDEKGLNIPKKRYAVISKPNSFRKKQLIAEDESSGNSIHLKDLSVHSR